MWWKKMLPCSGRAFFRTALPDRSEDFDRLSKHGITVQPVSAASGALWQLHLEHPIWGKAELAAVNSVSEQLPILVRFSRLSPAERLSAMTAKSEVRLVLHPQAGNVLRERKNLLRFLNAAAGNDALMVMDDKAEKIWSITDLQDEVQHDADVDIEALFTIHGVAQNPNQIDWVHTHGLGMVGGFDFDLLRPSPELQTENGKDFFRGVASAILEERILLNGPAVSICVPGEPMRFVDTESFHADAPSSLARLRTNDEAHRLSRGIACSEKDAPSLLGRIFGEKIRTWDLPQSFIRGEGVVGFSASAGELNAERARKTFSVFRSAFEEFAELDLPAMCRLGYPTDGDKSDKEHLVFRVHGCTEKTIDGTLECQPFKVKRMKPGERGSHSVDDLSDWAIATPCGLVTPRSLSAMHVLRAKRSEIAAMIKARK